MNYQRIYDEIIQRAKSRGLKKKLLVGLYFEKHHIIPRCLNGSNDKDNLVLLTAREHYLCHYLLWKIHKENKSLFYAYYILSNKNHIVNSNEFSKLRVEFSKRIKNDLTNRVISDETRLRMKNSSKNNTDEYKQNMSLIKCGKHIGKNNPMFGRKQSEETIKLIKENRKPIIYTDELRNKLSLAHKGKCLGSSNPMFGKTPPNAKPVTINEIEYPSINKAAAALKLTQHEVRKLLRK